mgnify:CR=1 FL=1
MTIKKLTRMPYAQAHIEIDENGNIYLFSYVTLVATLTADKWLTVYGLYSCTTCKHISAFIKEYCPLIDYSTAKSIYKANLRMNIETGEVENL